MNFNHLMEARSTRRKCTANNSNCYYMPSGKIRTTAGENVHMTMYCKNCGRREDIFLTKEEFFTHQKVIQKEIGDV
jgi:hypothetical protein